jgi:putative membrane protein
MEPPVSDQRKPASVYGQGDEPDPRFSLANERTALAWMRTALALVAAGVAIVSISSLVNVPRWSAFIGAASCLGGAGLAWRAVAGWARVERALRMKRALPSPRALTALAGGVIVLAALMLILSVAELSKR